MRKRTLAIVLVWLGVVLLAPMAQAEPPSWPFAGAWIGSDPAPPDGDGSTLHLQITKGPSVRIEFTDEFGTVCVNEGASDTFFRSVLTGRVDGDVLSARFTVAKCGSTNIGFLRGAAAVYEYNDNGTAAPEDDTLFDGFVLWERDG